MSFSEFENSEILDFFVSGKMSESGGKMSENSHDESKMSASVRKMSESGGKMSENSHDESIPKCLRKNRNFKILKSSSKSACLAFL